MGTIVKALLIFLVAAAAGLWLHAHVGRLPAAAVVSLSAPTVSISAPTTAQTSGYEEITGTAIMDTSAGLPAVPYVAYQPAGQGTITKQLIFADSRGCYPSAGDLPCAPTRDTYAYPVLETGQRIQVTGRLFENRFLVDTISVIG